MNILIISPFVPYPLDQGGKIRVYNIIKNLAASHAITLFALGNPGDAGLMELRELCEEVLVVERPPRPWLDLFRFLTGKAPYNVVRYRSEEALCALRELLRRKRFDLVQVEFSMMWQYASLFSGIPVVLDAHNIEYRNVRQIGQAKRNPMLRLLYAIEERRLKETEETAFRVSDACFAVSEAERGEISLSSGTPDKVVTAVNGVDLDRFAFRPRETSARRILFLGGMDYFPNLDAATFFLDEVFPLVRRREPGAKLLLVGRELGGLGDRLSVEGVECHESVPEVLPWFYQADVLAVPLRLGAGTRIKVLEAMAAGLPVVATGKGCEGIEVTDGKELLVAESAEDFADAVLRVMGSPELAKRLAENAFVLVQQHYRWEKIASIMEETYRTLTKQ